MKLERLDAQTLRLSDIAPLAAHFLQELPDEAGPGDDRRALERLYSAPARGPEEQEFLRDWEEWVKPELQGLFESAVERVRRDLREGWREREGKIDLRLPVKNLEAWLSCLNQARLVLACREGFTEEVLEAPPPEAVVDRFTFRLLQMYVYGLLMECFLEQMEDPEG